LGRPGIHFGLPSTLTPRKSVFGEHPPLTREENRAFVVAVAAQHEKRLRRFLLARVRMRPTFRTSSRKCSCACCGSRTTRASECPRLTCSPWPITSSTNIDYGRPESPTRSTFSMCSPKCRRSLRTILPLRPRPNNASRSSSGPESAPAQSPGGTRPAPPRWLFARGDRRTTRGVPSDGQEISRQGAAALPTTP